MNTDDLVRETNRIEGILREPTGEEITEHIRFVCCPEVTLDRLLDYVRVYQSGAVLRNRVGLDVRVGAHLPPPGAPELQERVVNLLYRINLHPAQAWELHVAYEQLHPFTDCNGRSGRALWYWCMQHSRQSRLAELGFLHAFYYQTLAANGRRETL